MLDTTAVKAYHVLFPMAAGALSAASGVAGEGLYPDTRAFLIYGGYGAMGAAALGMWSTRFRSLWKFLAVLFTGIVLGGTVGGAVSEWTGKPQLAGLASFCAALVGPGFVVDPLGTVKKIGQAIGHMRKSLKDHDHKDEEKPGG